MNYRSLITVLSVLCFSNKTVVFPFVKLVLIFLLIDKSAVLMDGKVSMSSFTSVTMSILLTRQ